MKAAKKIEASLPESLSPEDEALFGHYAKRPETAVDVEMSVEERKKEFIRQMKVARRVMTKHRGLLKRLAE